MELSRWFPRGGWHVLVLCAPVMAGLPACDGGAPGTCEGAECPPAAGEPVVVASPQSDASIHSLVLSRSGDAAIVSAGWSELYDQERLYVATSTDGAATFGGAVQVGAPEDVELSYLRLQMPAAGGLLAGAVAHVPDPMASSWHAWPRVYRSNSTGASFEQLGDLQSAVGERSFTQGAFAASEDGQTVVWAWVDATPEDWLEPGSAPTGALLASISVDSGKTFAAPQVVSAQPFPYATRIAAFVREGRVGVVFAEARDIPGQPIEVGVAALALAGEDGTFQEPISIASDDYGAVPAGGAVGSDGAAPGAALGADGSIHVAWWSALNVGLWYAVSPDGQAFSEPVRVLETASPTPANVRVAVDGSGSVWVAALDGDGVRVVQIPPGQAPIESVGAAAPLGGTGDTFDVIGLPDNGAMLLWLGTAPGDDPGASRPIQLRLLAP